MFLLFNLKEVFTALNVVENKTRNFILARLETLNGVIEQLNDGYELEISLETDGIHVEIANQVLQDSNLPSAVLDVEFKFSLVCVEVEFVIVLDRNNDEYSDAFKMNYDNLHEQFHYILKQLLEYNQESKMQLLNDLQNNETHGIIHDDLWQKSARNYLKFCVDNYNSEDLKQKIDSVTNAENVKDKYKIHNSLLSLNEDDFYKHFELLIDNLNHSDNNEKEKIKDLIGYNQPDYIKEK